MRYFLFILSFLSILEANEITRIQSTQEKTVLTFNHLSSLEKGIKRDFFINEYLKKDISSSESLKVLSLVDNMNNKIFLNFAKKFNHDETLAVAQCMNMDTKLLINSYADCIILGLSLEEATSLSSIEIDMILQKISTKYQKFSKKLKVISSSIPFTKLITSKKDDFYDIYLNVGDAFRSKYFNYKLPKRTFAKIFKDKEKFDTYIEYSVTNPKLTMVHKTLLDIDTSSLSSNSLFLLALNAIRFNDLNKAYNYLNSAINIADNSYDMDRYKFWLYQISKNNDILEEVSNSLNINIYSLYANERLSKVSKDTNFLEDNEFMNSLKKEYDNSRIALLYTITKLKSEFKEDKISSDFEIGLMQLKSNFVKNIATVFNEEYNIFKQLEANTSLKYANIHLNSLENSFKNPVYLFLAYQGNSELLNKKKNNGLFLNKNSYEPFYSLELLSNKDKSLKKVLSYYYLYLNKINRKTNQVSLESILSTLHLPDQI